MGIQGLLPFVQKACRSSNVSEFAGCSVAIDGHCWLHRAAYGCADKLVKGQKTTQYVTFCMKYLDMLMSHKIKPVVVFDGRPLPAKKDVQTSRREKKKQMKARAEALESEGNYKEARIYYAQCFDITPAMVQVVIQACRSLGIDCIVAPFEADAQLTYLLKSGIVHFVITEDSDLIAYGCKRILFKLDASGNGILYERRSLFRCLGPRATLLLSPGRSNDELLFTRFRYACILSGCDYHPGGLNGVGLQKACKAMMGCSNILSIDRMLNRLPQYLRNMHIMITKDYKDKFIRANNTFLYQIVFDPISRQLVPLTDLPIEMKNLSLTFAGHGILTDEETLLTALGHVRVDDTAPKKDLPPHAASDVSENGIWSRNFRHPAPFKSPPKTPLVKRRSLTDKVLVIDMSSPARGSILRSTSIQDEMMVIGTPARTPPRQLQSASQDSVLRVKRRLPFSDSQSDEIATPRTPKKRMLSWSAPSTNTHQLAKNIRGVCGMSYHKKSTVKELSLDLTPAQSSYFGDLAVPSTSQKSTPISETSDYFSDCVSPNASIDRSGDEVIICPQVYLTGSQSPDRVTIEEDPLPIKPCLSPPCQKKKSLPAQAYQFKFAHLAYKKSPTV